MTLRELGTRLGARVDACGAATRKADGEQLLARHHLDVTPDRLRDYARARTIFEMTRDGGPWNVRWSITDKDPTSRFVWDAWKVHAPLATGIGPSVTAE